MSAEFEIQGLELQVQELTEELEEVQSSRWQDTKLIVSLERHVDDLQREVRALQLENDLLRLRRP